MENEIAAVFRAVHDRLTEDSETWGEHAYAEIAPAKVARPFVVWSLVESRKAKWRGTAGGEVVLNVLVTADGLATALTGAGRIAELLHDADRGADHALDGGDDWAILNATCEETLYHAELINGVMVYRAGGRYRFMVEGV